MSGFATWEEAFPYAVRIAQKLALRSPWPLDVDSLVMEALWRAQVGGAVFSRGYVHLRVTGAVKDEMRRVAEGQRHNYQDAGAFVDVDDDDHWGLRDERAPDLIEAIDQRRTLEALPEAAQYLVRETLIAGRSQEELAHDYSVTPATICQVLAQLKAKPSSVTRIPGTVDLHGELRKAAQGFLSRALDGAPSCTVLADRLGTARTTAYRWTGPDKPLPKGIIAGRGGPLQAHLHRVGLGLARKAFVRAEGRWTSRRSCSGAA